MDRSSEIARAGRKERDGGRNTKPGAIRIALAVERSLALAELDESFEEEELEAAERKALSQRLAAGGARSRSSR